MADHSELNRYSAIIEKIFFDHWEKGSKEFYFDRTEIKKWATKLNIDLPSNLGDIIYSFRFRTRFPKRVQATEPEGAEWRIELAGKARYRFVLGKILAVAPREGMVVTKIPDATPELIRAYALDDEQALLAIVRYNRLIDIFLGLTTYSLQNHLRTSVKGIGQIEIDELYVGLDSRGGHYVIPVQAKGGNDRISVVQTKQDLAACAEKFGGLRCRPISVKFLPGGAVAMFEFVAEDDEIKIERERHYKLVPIDQIPEAERKKYRRSHGD